MKDRFQGQFPGRPVITGSGGFAGTAFAPSEAPGAALVCLERPFPDNRRSERPSMVEFRTPARSSAEWPGVGDSPANKARGKVRRTADTLLEAWWNLPPFSSFSFS